MKHSTATKRQQHREAPKDNPDKNNRSTRQCLVTGRRSTPSALVRFVIGPDDGIVPDINGKLPGRGIWVGAQRELVDQAAAKNLFGRSARRAVIVPKELSNVVEGLLIERTLNVLGLGCRSGQITTGFGRVVAALQGRQPAFLIEASDGSAHGREKILRLARRQGRNCPILGCFTAAELGLAMGRDNVVHAAVSQGGLARRLEELTARLAGFRPIHPAAGSAE